MEFELNHIKDKFQQCIHAQVPTFTDFIDLGVRKRYNADRQSTHDVKVIEYHAFKEDERRIIGFFPQSYLEFMNEDQMRQSFPITCLRIDFSEMEGTSVSHRDVLGSILGLGLERKLFGDIILDGKCAYVVCHERIVPVLQQELFQIRRSSVHIKVLSSNDDYKDLVPKSVALNITVASLRIDVVLKGVLNLSRTMCSELIEQGKVKINQLEVTKNCKQVDSGDILSVSKNGKYKINWIGTENKKGRIPIIVDRYI
jgi:RNA-binding protein YlmH